MSKVYVQIRHSIKNSPKSRYQLCKDADVDQAQLARLMAGSSGLSVESMERLIEALGLEIILCQKKTRKGTNAKEAGKCRA